MAIYQIGSKGPEVGRIQQFLRDRGLSSGPVDGIFGGGTEGTVRAFQKAAGLPIDGQVGPSTWTAMFGEAPQPPSLLTQPLAFRCLALSGAFETDAPPPECFAGLTGDFDGQGLSFGALQWCLGQGRLQPLLRTMRQRFPDRLEAVFGARNAELVAMLDAPLAAQMEWARSIQAPRFRVDEPWRGCFKALGRTPEYQGIEVEAAEALFAAARGMCHRFALTSQRAVALMFDIRVQNGEIPPAIEAAIRTDMAALGPTPPDEVAVLRIIANRRAEDCKPAFVEDVRRRKLAIAEGVGIVHGNTYDLAGQYGIDLSPAQ